MNDVTVLPELRQIVGALLFGAKQPLQAAEIQRILAETAEAAGGAARDFARVSEADIRAAVEQIRSDLEGRKLGLLISEVANGYRLENDVGCGPWVRQMLNPGRTQRLSRPALETLAIIAYRQPCTRAEIESVRGVQVDQIIRNLLDLQVIRVTGRSELPGRPWLFGTTQKFLEYFGLKNLDQLPNIDELRRIEAERARAEEARAAAVAQEERASGD